MHPRSQVMRLLLLLLLLLALLLPIVLSFVLLMMAIMMSQAEAVGVVKWAVRKMWRAVFKWTEDCRLQCLQYTTPPVHLLWL